MTDVRIETTPTAAAGRSRLARFLLGGALLLATCSPAEAFLGFSTGPGFLTRAENEDRPAPIEGEALVRFKAGVDRSAARQATVDRGVTMVRDYRLLSGRRGQEYGLVRSTTLGTAELLARLEADPRVDRVMPNFVGRIAAIPNDPQFGDLWGLHNTGQEVLGMAGAPDADIDAPEAWDEGPAGGEAVVAVIDTGVDYTHEDLAAARWVNPGEIPGNDIDDDGNGWIDDIHGADMVHRDGNPMDDYGHGTHVAGTIAAVPGNGIGIAGVASGARIMALKVFDEDGYGSVANVIAAVEYVTDMKLNRGVDVVAMNASFTFFTNATWLEIFLEDGDIFYDAVDEAAKAGIMLVAAAGNYARNNDESTDATIMYPASYNLPNVISVAASDSNDEPAYFTNWGPRTVDLYAPGVNVLSTWPGEGYDPGTTGIDWFRDDLESGAGEWNHHGLGDTWELTDAEARGPGHSWRSTVPASGATGTGGILELVRDIDLTGAVDGTAELAFWVASSLTGPEGRASSLRVQVSPNGGASWWITPTIITGSFDWRLFHCTLPLSYLSNRVRVRFILEGRPDGIGVQRVALDDIGIGIAPSRGYAWAAGTSMAAPHVTGAVALMAARYPLESIVARRNRLLTGVDVTTSFFERVVTGGRLNLAKAAGFDVPPLIEKLDPPDGALTGATVRVKGVNFGPGTGRVLLEGSPGTDFRVGQFCFRFLKVSQRWGIERPGVHVDDVRLASPSTVYFEDGMESGDGKWYGTGRPPRGVTWEITNDEAHGGSYSWSDSTLARYPPWGLSPDGQHTYLRNAAPIDLAATAGEKVTLGFWALVGNDAQSPLSIGFSRDGGVSWEQVAVIPSDYGTWRYYEFEVPGASLQVEATVLDWSDTEVAIEVPPGALHHLQVLTAAGTPSVNHAPLTAWTSRTPAGWYSNSGSPLVAANGRLYLLGLPEYHDAVHEMTVSAYEPATDSWTENPAWRLPGKRNGQAAAAVGGRIFLIGGAPYADSTRLDIFSSARGTWTSGASLPGGLYNLAAVAIDNAVYAIGGATLDEEATRGVQRYDPATGRWTRRADLGQRRAGHAAAVARGKIWVFGGHDQDWNSLASAEVYDPATDEWTRLPDLPGGARDFVAAASDGRFIYVTGGYPLTYASPSDVTFVFDTVEEGWTGTGGTSLDLLTPRSRPGMAFLPGSGLYITGNAWGIDDRLEFLDVQRLYGELDVTWPDGGETLASGATVTFTWGAPPEAHHFSVQFFDGQGSIRLVAENLTATAVRWQLPVVTANLPFCRVQVTAFDAAGNQIGSVESDGGFRVDVVRVLWPVEGSYMFVGDTRTIRWRTYATRRPVARTLIYYAVEDLPWKKIASIPGNPGRWNWRIPKIAPELMADTRLRLTLLDSRGRSLGEDGNDYPFFIMDNLFRSPRKDGKEIP